MVIAFFSTVHGQAGTSANMLAVGIMSVLKYQKKVLLLQSHYDRNSLEDFLLKKPRQVQEAEVLDDYGIDNIYRNRKLYSMDKDMLLGCCYSFLEGRLQLLPGTSESNREVFEASKEDILSEVIHLAQEHFDFVFIDVNATYGFIREKILEQSDIMVANFCQNPKIMARFFDENKFREDKLIYMIGNYDKKSQYNLTNLKFLFSKMNKKNTVFIEYSRYFKEAAVDNELLTFFKKFYECSKKDKNYSYIKSVNNAASFILKKAGESYV